MDFGLTLRTRSFNSGYGPKIKESESKIKDPGPEKEDLPELVLGTKQEDLPESQLAYPGDKEGGPAGGLPKTAEGPPHRANLLLSRSYSSALSWEMWPFLLFG